MNLPPSTHRAHSRHLEGFALSLVPVVLWGILPVAIAGVIDPMDGVTLTWLRFLVALVAQSAVLALTGTAGWPWHHPPASLRLMLIVAVGIVANFSLFSVSLQYLPASTGATLSQLQPIMMLVLAAMLTGQPLRRGQALGAVAIVAGTTLFMHDRLLDIVQWHAGTGVGVALCLAGGLVWAIGGVAQMRIPRSIGIGHIMWTVYALGSVVLAPFASPAQVLRLDSLQWALLAFLCLNTILAYSAFALALRRWDLPRVSAVLATGVVFTYGTEWLLHAVRPGLVTPEAWTWFKIAGSLLVIGGSLSTALAQPAVGTQGTES
jgi:drug/metabolite transporter (DMT)-like permease